MHAFNREQRILILFAIWSSSDPYRKKYVLIMRPSSSDFWRSELIIWMHLIGNREFQSYLLSGSLKTHTWKRMCFIVRPSLSGFWNSLLIKCVRIMRNSEFQSLLPSGAVRRQRQEYAWVFYSVTFFASFLEFLGSKMFAYNEEQQIAVFSYFHMLVTEPYRKAIQRKKSIWRVFMSDLAGLYIVWRLSWCYMQAYINGQQIWVLS